METSKLSNDSLFRKKEKAIQQYISMIGDQKFFDQMRGQGADKERPLLRAIVGANQRNHYDSRYGKSKSVSLQDDGIIDDRPASEDFGNDSNYGDNNETPGKNFGDTIHEVPHNDPKGRDEFHFKSRTVYSQASETKPDRSKEPSKPILREITILQKGPDETRSEALPKSKNKTSSGLLPSLSKPTVSGVAINPQTLQKNLEVDFQKRPSVTTKQDFHIEPRTGEAQTSEFKLVNEMIRSEPKNLKEASRPTIRDMGIEPRLLESKESAGYLEQKPVSIAPTAPRPISALQGEGKTSNFTIRNTNKRQPDPRSSPSLDEIGSSISKFDKPMPQLNNQGSRRSVDKSGRRTAPEIPKLIPLL